MTRLMLCIAAFTLLAACMAREPTWYEDRCLRLGFKAGSTEFNDCVERDQRWDDDNRRRANEAVGP